MRTREQKLFFFSLRETFNQKYFIKIYFNFNYSENIIDQKYIVADNHAGVGKIVQSSVCCLLVGNSLHILLQFWSRESGVGEGESRENQEYRTKKLSYCQHIPFVPQEILESALPLQLLGWLRLLYATKKIYICISFMFLQKTERNWKS